MMGAIDLVRGALSRLRRDDNDEGDMLISARASTDTISVAVHIPGDATPAEIEAVRQSIESELARVRADAEASLDRGEADV